MVIIGKASPRRMELKIYKERDRGSVGGEGCTTLNSIRYGGKKLFPLSALFVALKKTNMRQKKVFTS